MRFFATPLSIAAFATAGGTLAYAKAAPTRAAADKLLDACEAGDLAAIKEFGDRIEGKAAQAIIGDRNADPVQVNVKWQDKQGT